MGTPDIIIDTNVLFAALKSQRGASSKLLSLLGDGYFVSHVSVPLLLEYEDVLTRKKFGFNADDVQDLIDAVCALSQWHEIHYLWRPMLPDKNDEMILELAIKAGAASIITYNTRDFKGASQFGIDVLRPKAFLDQIEVI